MAKASHLCPDCNAVIPGELPRCAQCRRSHDAKRWASKPHLHGDWQTKRDRVKAAWIATHGYWCPGYEVPAHPSQDLTVDHVTNRNDSVLSVLCRSCNSRKK